MLSSGIYRRHCEAAQPPKQSRPRARVLDCFPLATLGVAMTERRRTTTVMPGFMLGIHASFATTKGMDARVIGVRSTPSFGRLCPGMTWREL
jgi:hypothetical protein